MSLRDRYQGVLGVDSLYEVRSTGLGVEQLRPSIEVIGGTVNIYVSQVQPISPPTGMNIIDGGDGLVGSASFGFVQNYIYIEEVSAVTSVVFSGFEVSKIVLGSGFSVGFSGGFG